jgi:hypothetical protein
MSVIFTALIWYSSTEFLLQLVYQDAALAGMLFPVPGAPTQHRYAERHQRPANASKAHALRVALLFEHRGLAPLA